MLAKLFSTRTHGILDYVSVGTLLILPRALGWGKGATNLATGAALGTLGASLMTKYELSLAKIIPMEGHLALDGASGALFAVAPLLFRGEKGLTKGLMAGLGLFEIMAALTTDTKPSLGERVSEAGESAADTVRGAAS
jgi:hypothetical protein